MKTLTILSLACILSSLTACAAETEEPAPVELRDEKADSKKDEQGTKPQGEANSEKIKVAPAPLVPQGVKDHSI